MPAEPTNPGSWRANGQAEDLMRKIPLLVATLLFALLSVPPYGRNILIAGPSGSGKSTFATALIEPLENLRFVGGDQAPQGCGGAMVEDMDDVQLALGAARQGQCVIKGFVGPLAPIECYDDSFQHRPLPLRDVPQRFAHRHDDHRCG